MKRDRYDIDDILINNQHTRIHYKIEKNIRQMNKIRHKN